MIERAVVADGICAQLAPLTFARLAVGDVKRFLIWRQQYRAGADRVVGQPGRDPGSAVIALKTQHRAMIEKREDRRPERNDRMARIGEIESALPVDNEIARLIVIFAVEQGVDRDGPPVGRELDEPPSALLGAVHFAVRAEGEAIHAVGIAAKLSDFLAGMVEPEQPAFVDRAEQHLAVRGLPDDAAGRALERPGNEFELPSLGCEGITCSYQTGTPGMPRRVRYTE